MPSHSYAAGKIRLYKRGRSRFWQCTAFVGGRKYRKSTQEDNLIAAREFAEDWLLELQGRHRTGNLKHEKTVSEAAKQFVIEYETITQGERSPAWVRGHKDRLRLHLLPFFGDLGLSEVTAGKTQEYRMHRIQTSSTGKPPVSDVSAYGTILTNKLFCLYIQTVSSWALSRPQVTGKKSSEKTGFMKIS